MNVRGEGEIPNPTVATTQTESTPIISRSPCPRNILETLAPQAARSIRRGKLAREKTQAVKRVISDANDRNVNASVPKSYWKKKEKMTRRTIGF